MTEDAGRGAIVLTAGAVLTGSVTDEGLQRGLTRFHALAIVVGTVVGTGIYLRPASIAQLVQSPFRVLTIWVAAGLFTLAGALTYAELASRLPRSGGEYAFLRETLGEFPAFLFGWMRLTVGVSAIAAMAVAVAVFVSDLVPLGGLWWHYTFWFFGGSCTVDLGARQAVAVLVIFALAALNVSGVARAGRFQGILTSAKVIGLTALIGVLAFAARAHAVDTNYSVTSSTAPGVLGYGGALLAALAPYNGLGFSWYAARPCFLSAARAVPIKRRRAQLQTQVRGVKNSTGLENSTRLRPLWWSSKVSSVRGSVRPSPRAWPR